MASYGSIAGAAGALTGVFQVGGGFIGSTLASVAFTTASSALVTLMPIMAALAVATALFRRIAVMPAQLQAPET
jgi:DHA1 family bicyclomycin/chloramphenicol resistance-like MFS transporter